MEILEGLRKVDKEFQVRIWWISCHYTPLLKSEDMMGKPKPQDSFRLLLVEVLYRGKFFKNKEHRDGVEVFVRNSFVFF
jgi:hypothetical protein